jgi:uncharacterized protein YecE (DUF72 family)
MTRIRIGISGWRYPPWRGTFYPSDLPQRAELEYASGKLSVIEINGTFYSLQRPESFALWYSQTPADFLFTLKAPRYITHMRRLKGVEQPLANWFASGIFALREKLGPIVWQLPPNFKYDQQRLSDFLDLLPADTASAAAMGRKRDAFMKGRTRLAIDANRPLRHAIEVRHDSFATASFIDRSGYSDKALDHWARRIAAWARGSEPADAKRVTGKGAPGRAVRDVYCFFDNTDVKLRAPFDAQTLMKKLRLKR